MTRPVPVHYLRPNHAEWAPACVISMDTETRWEDTERGELHRLRLWAATMDDRRPTRSGKQETLHGWGKSAGELADWIAGLFRGRTTIWLYCHNLSVDLVTTRLPLELVQRGWTITDAAVAGKAPWMRLGKGRRVLTLCDSWGWLPTSLAEVSARTTASKPALPEADDSEQAWLERCQGDVAVLRESMLALMAWWEAEKLGRWTVTGAACGWNAYRHTPTLWPVVIDPDPDKVKADRAAVYGGRRGTWRIGTMAAGPYLELDVVAAYPTTAASRPLPVKRAYQVTEVPTDDERVSSERWGLLAHCRIRTPRPRWPVQLHHHVWYPVGEFDTVLAGPDIAEAQRLGCLVSIHHGWVHQLGHAMAPWAEWVLALQRGELEGAPAVAQITGKHWGRAVIGKWSAHGYEKLPLGPAPTDGWGYEEGWDHDHDSLGAMVDIAGQRWWVAATEASDNAYPAVLAWVEAEVRVRLTRVIEAIGEGAVVQCDTDGLIVAERVMGTRAARGNLRAPEHLTGAARVRWVLDQLDPVTAPLTVRIKRQHDHVTVLGPQHMMLGDSRRYSGIPGMATTEDGETFKGHTWPGLSWQMSSGSAEGYLRPEVERKIVGPYATGWVLSDGRVVPVQTRITAAGRTVIVPWPLTEYARSGLRIAPRQNPALDEV